MVNVRSEICCAPASRVGIRHQSGDFAVDILELGYFGNIFAPRIQDVVFYSRHTAVIQDESDVGALADQIDGDGQLAVENTNVERKSVIAERSNVFDKQFPLSQFVGLRVQDTTNAFQLCMAGDFVEVRLEISIFWPAAGYDPFDGIAVLVCEVQQVLGFCQHMEFIHICFQMHGLDDAETLRGLAVIEHSKGTVEGREGVEPGVTKQIQVP